MSTSESSRGKEAVQYLMQQRIEAVRDAFADVERFLPEIASTPANVATLATPEMHAVSTPPQEISYAPYVPDITTEPTNPADLDAERIRDMLKNIDHVPVDPTKLNELNSGSNQ